MFAEGKSLLITAPFRNEDAGSQKRLRSNPKLINYLLMKFVADQALVDFGSEVLRYIQPSDMTAQQYADDSVAKSCKVADVYVDRT